MRLIDADALIELLRPYGHMDEKIPFDVLVTDVEVQPTIEAEPVRRGRWEEEDERSAYKGFLVSCSECGAFLEERKKEHFAYCYRCGAKMDGE